MPAREIKTTLALDGEKAFKASMDEAYRGLKVLGSEMKLNTAIFADNANSMEALTKKGEILGKEVAQQKEIVAALAKAVEDSAAAYGENDKRTDDYRVKLNNATTTLTKMEGELSANEAAIQGFGQETQATEKKTINWTEALKTCADVMGKGITAAAKATGVAIAAVGTAAVAGAKQLFDMTKGAGEFADELLTTSAQTGISTENLQKWSYAARFVDVDVSTMTGSMAKMIKQMDGAKTGTTASAAAFNKLGIDITGSNGQLRDSQTVFMEAIDALGKVTNETERDALAMQIFGKSAQELNPLIKAGSDELSRLGQEAEAAGLVLDSQALGALGNFDDTMQRIQAQTQGLTRTLAVEFLPAVSGVMTEVQTVLTGVSTALKDGFQPEDIATIGNMIAQKLIDGVNTIAEYLPSIISTVSGMLTQLVGMVVTLLPALLPPLMEGATQLLTGVLSAISSNLSPLMQTATTLVVQFVKFLTQNLPTILKMGVQMLLELVNGITKAIPDIIPAAVEGVMAMVQGIVGALPQIIKAGIEMVVALVKGLIDSIPKIIAAIPSLIQSVVTAVTTNLPVIIKAGIELTVALIAGLIKAIPQLIASMPQIIAGVVKGLLDGIGSIWDVGKNLVQGLWDGIKNTTTWLWNKLKGWINDALGWIADLLGIHSPSTVMRDRIGLNMGKGVAEGVTDSAKYVNRAMRDLIPDTASTGVMLDVTRRFNDVAGDAMQVNRTTTATTNLSESALSRLESALVKAVQNQSGDVYLDGKKVGIATARYVSDEQAKNISSLQRSGFRGDIQGAFA